MSFAARFEELRIWQDAREQVTAIYRCIAPKSAGFSDFAFRDQLQRAAISTMNNIAEGFERKTFKDFAHFLDLAKGSCGEVRSMLYLAEDLNYITKEQSTVLRNAAENLSRGIATFQKHLRS